MTLSTRAKDYIASHFGRNNCYTSSGVSYTDPTGTRQTGSTMDVVSTLEEDPFGNGPARGPNGEMYKNIPDYQSITPQDIMGIGSSSYCVSGGGATGCVTGTRRCNGNYAEVCVGGSWKRTYCPDGCSGGLCNIVSGGGGVPGSQDTTGPFEVWVGESSGTGCPPGDPSVTLDTSSAYAYYKSDPTSYVGVMDIMVRNNNSDDCYAYFAWEMRMWPGSGYTTCPAATPEVIEISRFLATVSATRAITLKKILANETEMVSGSFAIPSGVEGQKTICLTLWGNYSYSALVDELAAAGYSKEIPW